MLTSKRSSEKQTELTHTVVANYRLFIGSINKCWIKDYKVFFVIWVLIGHFNYSPTKIM